MHHVYCLHHYSSTALPEQYRNLMTDPSSPILEFYPSGNQVFFNEVQFFTKMSSFIEEKEKEKMERIQGHPKIKPTKENAIKKRAPTVQDSA